MAKVFPTFLTSNIEGALMSYQSVVNVLNKMIKTPCRIIMLTLASEGVDNLLLDTLFTF